MLVQNFCFGPKWVLAIIAVVTGLLSYKVMFGDGRVVRRHVDQILAHNPKSKSPREGQSAVPAEPSQAAPIDHRGWEVEDVVFSSDKIEPILTPEPVPTTAAAVTTQTQATPGRRPNYLVDYQLD